MSDTWHTLSQAAALLNVSPRTIRRRIEAESWPTDMGTDNRRRVLIPEDALVTPDRDNADPVIGHAAPPLSGDSVTGHALTTADAAPIALFDRLTAQADARTTSARRWSVAGWFVAFILLAAAGVGAWFTATEITAAQVNAQADAGQIAQLQADLDTARQTANDNARQLADRGAEIARMASELEQAHAAAEQAEAVSVDLQARIDQLQDELKQAKAIAPAGPPLTDAGR